MRDLFQTIVEATVLTGLIFVVWAYLVMFAS